MNYHWTKIMEHLISHYKLQIIKIAERFKFFKRHQLGGESTTEVMTELWRLAKTCNFGDYLETAIRDQFVCGLRDMRTQQELLCIPELTAKTAFGKAYAAEAVYKKLVPWRKVAVLRWRSISQWKPAIVVGIPTIWLQIASLKQPSVMRVRKLVTWEECVRQKLSVNG